VLDLMLHPFVGFFDVVSITTFKKNYHNNNNTKKTNNFSNSNLLSLFIIFKHNQR